MFRNYSMIAAALSALVVFGCTTSSKEPPPGPKLEVFKTQLLVSRDSGASPESLLGTDGLVLPPKTLAIRIDNRAANVCSAAGKCSACDDRASVPCVQKVGSAWILLQTNEAGTPIGGVKGAQAGVDQALETAFAALGSKLKDSSIPDLVPKDLWASLRERLITIDLDSEDWNKINCKENEGCAHVPKQLPPWLLPEKPSFNILRLPCGDSDDCQGQLVCKSEFCVLPDS